MRHLTPSFAIGALRRGKQIEQFLGGFRPLTNNRTANGDSEPGRAELPPSAAPMWLGCAVTAS